MEQKNSLQTLNMARSSALNCKLMKYLPSADLACDNNMFAILVKNSNLAESVARTNFFLDRLSFTHAILGEAVGQISTYQFIWNKYTQARIILPAFRSFGLTLLALLASCLLHLVATGYFLFIELLGDMVSVCILVWHIRVVSRFPKYIHSTVGWYGSDDAIAMERISFLSIAAHCRTM